MICFEDLPQLLHLEMIWKIALDVKRVFLEMKEFSKELLFNTFHVFGQVQTLLKKGHKIERNILL